MDLENLHIKLDEVRRLNRVSYGEMSSVIGYSQNGLSKALSKKTLSIMQIKKIIEHFNYQEHFDNLLTQKDTHSKISVDAEDLFYTLSSGEKVSFKEIALICGENEDVLMNFKAFSNIIDIRVAKALAIMSADPNKLAEFLNS